MTTEEPKVTPTGRYSSNEAAKALGIHRNTLRSYTDKGYIRCKFRRNTYRPFYMGSEILRFWRAEA